MIEQEMFVAGVRELLSRGRSGVDLVAYYDNLASDHPLKQPFEDRSLEWRIMLSLTSSWVIDDCLGLRESAMRKKYGKERV